MILKTILILFFNTQLLLLLQAQNKSDLYTGWNHLINLGVSANSNFSINPKVGQEGNSIQLGLDLEISNINIDTDFIFENSFILNLGIAKSPSDVIELPQENKTINPYKKNYDYLTLKTKYSKQLGYSNNYIAGESFINTQLLPSYTDNYLKGHTEEHVRLAQFISPMTATVSIGYEKRNDFDYVIYFSPFTTKIIYVGNDEIAATPALNSTSDTTIYLGSSLHGNDLIYDEEQQRTISYKKSRIFYGSQLSLEYNKEIIDKKLLVQAQTRFFYNYNGKKKHLDINANVALRFNVIAGLSLGITSEFIDDDNLFFQDLSQQNNKDIGRTNLKQGSSYSHRLVFNYSLSK